MRDTGATQWGGVRGVISTVALASIALVVGVLLFLLSSANPAFLFLALLLMAGGAAMLLLPDLRLRLMCAYILAAPVAVSKALALGAGVYAPALEVTAADLCIVTLLPFWIITKLHKNESLLSALRPWPAISFFFLWAWFSASHAEIVTNGMLSALNLSKYLVVFVVLSDLIDSPRRLRWVLYAMAAGLALQAIMTGAQLATKSMLLLPGMKTSDLATLGISMKYVGAGEFVSAFRPFGFLQHPVFLASYLVLVLPVVLAVVLAGKKVFGRLPWLASVALLLAGGGALIATLSRGGWIAFGVGAIFVFVAGIRMGLVRRAQLVAAGALAVCGVLVTFAVYPAVYYRLTQSDDRSGESRWLMIKQAGFIIRDAPVIGVGLATYTRVAKRVMPPEFSAYSEDFRQTIAAGVVHNAYLAFWAERGLIGLTGVLLLYASFFRATIRLKRWRAPAERALALGLAGGLVGQLVMFNFDHAYLDSRPGILWMFLAVFAALLRMQREPIPVTIPRATPPGVREPLSESVFESRPDRSTAVWERA